MARRHKGQPRDAEGRWLTWIPGLELGPRVQVRISAEDYIMLLDVSRGTGASMSAIMRACLHQQMGILQTMGAWEDWLLSLGDAEAGLDFADATEQEREARYLIRERKQDERRQSLERKQARMNRLFADKTPRS